MIRLSVDVRFRHASGFDIDAKFATDSPVAALVGPSGSGKSSLLHLIAGVLQPSDGSIRVGDRVLVDTQRGVNLAPEDRRVGMVFQDHLLFPHLSVRKNLEFGMGRRGGRSMHLGKVVEVLEIGELLHRAPASLSGGQRQRVALGRALLRGPELLLLDEPLAALDNALKARVLNYLSLVFQEWRIPTVFVSHETQDVAKVATQVISMQSGRIAGVTSIPP